MPESPTANPNRPNPDPNCVEKWIQAMRDEDARVLAILRQEIGPDGDLKAAYRRWYEEQMREHTAGLIHMLENLHRAQQQTDTAQE